MIWKGFGVLAGTAALIVLGVVGLARLTVPDEPTFSEGLEEAAESENNTVDFTPTAVGGQLEVTGAAEGTITLERTAHGPTYGLENSKTRLFFESDPLTISQMSYEGLAFFPEPEDCEFTEGEHNEEAGLVGVEVSCPELVDIRDNGTITLEGVLALPADLVIEVDTPDTGGTITIGGEEWEIVNPLLFVGPRFRGDELTEIEFNLFTNSAEKGLNLVYNDDSGRMALTAIHYDQRSQPVEGSGCNLMDEEVMIVNPQMEFHELTIDCEDLEVPGLGTVSIEGSVVYEKIFAEES